MSDGIWFQDSSSTYPFVPKKKETLDEVREILDEVYRMLEHKNYMYGDSALNPLSLFSKLEAVDALCVRLDDKLKRIKNSGLNEDTEDTVKDILGYLVLLQIARKRKGGQ